MTRDYIDPKTQGKGRGYYFSALSGVDIKAVARLNNKYLDKTSLNAQIKELENQLNGDSNTKYQLSFAIIDNLTRRLDRLKLLKELDGEAILLGNMQTISISSHREKMPVRSFGSIQPKAYTRGARTIAGSFVFTMVDVHAFDTFLQTTKMISTGMGESAARTANVSDQIPPFDIIISGASEGGTLMVSELYGVELVNEGIVLSVQDLMVEQTFQYVARDYVPPHVPQLTIEDNSISITTKASSLVEEYKKRANLINYPFF